MIDEFSVWLLLRSGVGQTGAEIGRAIGLPTNVPSINSIGRPRPGRTFFLKSDLQIDRTKPLSDHLGWVAEKCLDCRAGLEAFLGQSGNEGEIFIYSFCEDSAQYFDLPADSIRVFVELGMKIVIKAEFDGAE
jgi:hypothetical protein